MEERQTLNISEAKTRLLKKEAIDKLGVNAYPSKVNRDMPVAEAVSSSKKSDTLIWLAGKITSIRSHGKSGFADIQDQSGKIQLYIKQDEVGEKSYSFYTDNIDVGDYINVCGKLFTTKTKEPTLRVEQLILLAKSLKPLPDKWSGLTDTEIRYRKRYLDFLINCRSKENIILRSNIVANLRSFMQENGFIEVETPILQPIPGGASAKPFVTHYNILGQDFYLRIAPELYLKRMIVGGFEKIYEIGKVFRNEGLSHMHNPEFTIFEFYWAYKSYKDLMTFTEEMMSFIINKTLNSDTIKYQGKAISFKPPYPKITLREMILRDSGIDISKHKTLSSLKKVVATKKIELDKHISVWPKMVDELYKKVSRPRIIEPVFVTDHPVELSPLAKSNEINKEVTQRFQLLCAGGIELVNAYTELNDPIDQRRRFEKQAELKEAGWDESQLIDNNFIDALSYGLPPTAGWGMGIDRLVMLLSDNYSIKEVIAFPALKKTREN
ncbi:MAG TPA: lysine--tRNA ligase [bacterium]|nr:lysine--tRNA ligase [bacterium]HOR57389.1 lysine--tRNA ligase [bacterium]HPL56107.1 lysine--tRNA ligase [bacterium]